MNEQFESVAFEEAEEVVTTTNRKNGLKTVIGLGAVAGLIGGIVYLIKKNRHKINESRAKKLKKEGYVVLPPEANKCSEDEFDELIDSIE